MNDLNSLYIQMLHVGMLVLRQALAEGDNDWADAEVELLHNVPSLINEPDATQHEYFWKATRGHHIEWVSKPGRELAKSRMETYYEPLWLQMEPIVRKMINRATGQSDSTKVTTDGEP